MPSINIVELGEIVAVAADTTTGPSPTRSLSVLSDLDASAIVLDKELNKVDVVFFRHLTSNDGSIRHCGDEREGDAKGDDEKINLTLAQVNPSARYIGFCINSFSGQELDDVAKTSCHVFGTATGKVKFMFHTDSKARSSPPTHDPYYFSDLCMALLLLSLIGRTSPLSSSQIASRSIKKPPC